MNDNIYGVVKGISNEAIPTQTDISVPKLLLDL